MLLTFDVDEDDKVLNAVVFAVELVEPRFVESVAPVAVVEELIAARGVFDLLDEFDDDSVFVEAVAVVAAVVAVVVVVGIVVEATAATSASRS